MKVALVHDYLREYGGAERVLEALHSIWPNAPLYTSFVDRHALGDHAKRFAGWDIRTSWVQHNPLMRKFHSPLRFLAPKVWESFDLTGYDAVISSSGWFISRGVIVKPPSVHICYIHHPPRNLYGYPTGSTYQKYRAVRIYAGIVNHFLRKYDYETAQKVDHFIANSRETSARVRKFYRRDSTVIYPPVRMGDMKKRQKDGNDGYYLSVGRLAWAKRIDLAIEAANRMGFRLKVVGRGKEEESLRLIAGPTVEFVGGVPDGELQDLYRGAKALIFSALEEDFGMVPVEAMSTGTPVIALAQGGVVETVVDGETGILYRAADVDSLMDAVRRFEQARGITPMRCRKQAEQFSEERFNERMRDFVEQRLKHASG